jgi:hypothetical protein
MFNRNREDMAPWRDAGRKSLNELGVLLGLDPNGFNKSLGADATPAEKAAYAENFARLKESGDWNALNDTFTGADLADDAGYKFRMAQGTRAVQGSAAARGGVLNGGVLKELLRYGQGVASDEFQNAYSRHSNDQTTRFNRLATIAGIGQQATGQTAALGAATASNIGNNITQAGNSRAAGYVAAGNAINQGVSTIGNYFMNRSMMPSPAPVQPVQSTPAFAVGGFGSTGAGTSTYYG